VGVALAAGSLVLFMYLVIYRTLRPSSNIVAWIDWGNVVWAIGAIAAIGLALTLLPTLVMTRKYLKV
jgi:cell division transport system permease protein